MADRWTSSETVVVLPHETAERLCASGARRGGAVATLARREQQAARMVAWTPPGAPGGARPIGTFVIRWGHPRAGEATLGGLSWPPTRAEDELWRAIEELAGHALPR